MDENTLTVEEACKPASMWVLRAVHLLECDLILVKYVKVALDEHKDSTGLDASRRFEHRGKIRSNLWVSSMR